MDTKCLKRQFAKFPELRLATDNGVTLCKQCHKEIHKVKQTQAT